MRRHDLDWLRVIVFGLLIFYHVGMFFVPWGWHIKNNIIYEWFSYPMYFLNQWRLPILFVISGMGTYYALGKRSRGQFSKERLRRLGFPLLIGMLLIVPPQVYIERIAHAQFSGGYFDFWPAQAFIGVYPKGNLSWHHLWFLPYLLIFSLILVPIFYRLRKNPQNRFTAWFRKRVAHPLGIFIFIVPIYLAEAFMEPFFPVTHALWGDWYTLVYYIFLFFAGFILISVQDVFWATVQKYRMRFLLFGIIGFTVLLGGRFLFEDSTLIHFIEAFVKVFNVWAWILTLFGFAAHLLNKPSRTLAYCNEAVYPFYILHQTITIILAFYLMNLDWGLPAKFSALLFGTFFFSWIIYEFVIRRWNFIRPAFGLKLKKKH